MNAIRITILQVLSKSGSYAMPEDDLVIWCGRMTGETHTVATLAGPLQWLLGKGAVDYTIDGLSEVKRWSITAAGKQMLEGK